MNEPYHFACTSCGQARGARHWSTCAYANLTSPYVVEHQTHKVVTPRVPPEVIQSANCLCGALPCLCSERRAAIVAAQVPLKIACRCGWEGTNFDLAGRDASTGFRCPKCSKPFTSYPGTVPLAEVNPRP